MQVSNAKWFHQICKQFKISLSHWKVNNSAIFFLSNPFSKIFSELDSSQFSSRAELGKIIELSPDRYSVCRYLVAPAPAVPVPPQEAAVRPATGERYVNGQERDGQRGKDRDRDIDRKVDKFSTGERDRVSVGERDCLLDIDRDGDRDRDK